MVRVVVTLIKNFYVRAALVVLLIVGQAAFWQDLQIQFPGLVAVQLRFHQWLSHLDHRSSRVHWVTVVEIDDSTFYNEPFGGNTPTNRRALADLGVALVKARPVVIAFDIKLLSEPGRGSIRNADNMYLLKALSAIGDSGIPVILTRVLSKERDGEFKEKRNIFSDSELPIRIYVGHINLPNDRRHIPLEMRARTWDGGSVNHFKSFAQQIVNAYEEIAHIRKKTEANPLIRRAVQEGDFVYSGFLPYDEFDKISARDVLRDVNHARERSRNRIVIIGGTYHQLAGPSIETFQSPVGVIPGVYLHANYVEALNDDRFGLAVPRGWATLLDLAVAVLAYLAFLKTHRTASRLGVFVGLLLFLLAVPYVFASNFGLYLDFVAVLSLCLVHLVIEHYVELRARATKTGEGAAP